MDNGGNAPAYIQQEVPQAVNSALQVMWLDVPRERRSHYTRTITELDVDAGIDNYIIPKTQGILSPVWHKDDKCPLTPLTTKYEALAFTALDDRAAHGRPFAYFAERTATQDGTQINIMLQPVPIEDETIVLEVETMAPSYDLEDFCCESCPVIPLPMQYIESLLLPLANYYMARSSWFDNHQLFQAIERDYQRALMRAGATDPIAQGASATEATKDE